MSDLPAERLEVPADPLAFYEYSLVEGFGDGLPLIPPTEPRVMALLETTPYAPDHVLGMLAPQGVEATVAKIAVNAAMAACAPEAFPYVVAALEGVLEKEFNWSALAATTGSVTPMLIVNGPRRLELGFDMEVGCMGGAAGRGTGTVGRAVELCLRNIAGQRVGVTSQSVFGQPARTAGLCFAEWEEQSPWPSLAEQRGFAGGDEVVTVHGGMGTFPMADVHNDDARDLLYLIAKTIAFPLSNLFLAPTGANGEQLVAFNPLWAQRFGKEFPRVELVREFLWEHAWHPVGLWPEENRRILERYDRIDAQGRVRLVDRPDQIPVLVCGGRGNLHAVCLPSWTESAMQSKAIRRP
jgi:hypothetical protein